MDGGRTEPQRSLTMNQLDHADYPKRLKKMEDWNLRAIIDDCKDAINANPQAEKCQNGYYADEINYCAMELHKRSSK